MNIPTKYKIGQKFENSDRLFTLLGVEYIPSRSIRYILGSWVGDDLKWTYLYEYEIENFLEMRKKTSKKK